MTLARSARLILAILRDYAERLEKNEQEKARPCACCDVPATHYDDGRGAFTCDEHGLDKQEKAGATASIEGYPESGRGRGK